MDQFQERKIANSIVEISNTLKNLNTNIVILTEEIIKINKKIK